MNVLSLKIKNLIDTMNEMLSMLVSGVMGGGLVTTLLAVVNWKSNKKKNSAEADKAEAEADGEEQNNLIQINGEWEKIVERKEKDINHLEVRLKEAEEKKEVKDEQITKLYQEIGALRDENVTLREERSALKIEIERMKPMMCEIRKCAQRKPQSGY